MRGEPPAQGSPQQNLDAERVRRPRVRGPLSSDQRGAHGEYEGHATAIGTPASSAITAGAPNSPADKARGRERADPGERDPGGERRAAGSAAVCVKTPDQGAEHHRGGGVDWSERVPERARGQHRVTARTVSRLQYRPEGDGEQSGHRGEAGDGEQHGSAHRRRCPALRCSQQRL
jgi:hypothetical protein